EPADEPIGYPRRHLSEQQLVLPLPPPTAYEVVTLIQLGNQGGNVPRVVLEVSIQRDNNPSPGMVKAGHHGCGLSHVAAQPKSPHPGICRRRLNLDPGIVSAAVIYQDHLEYAGIRLQRLEDPVHQRAHVLRLVEERSNHGKIGAARAGRLGSYQNHTDGSLLAEPERYDSRPWHAS